MKLGGSSEEMLRYIVFKIGFAVKLIDTVSERSKEQDLGRLWSSC